MSNFALQSSLRAYFEDMKRIAVKLERECLILRHAVDASPLEPAHRVRCDKLQMYKGMVASVQSAEIRLSDLSKDMAKAPFALHELTDACEALCEETASLFERVEDCMSPYGFEKTQGPVEKPAHFYATDDESPAADATPATPVQKAAANTAPATTAVTNPSDDDDAQVETDAAAPNPHGPSGSKIVSVHGPTTPPHKASKLQPQEQGTPRTPVFNERKHMRTRRTLYRGAQGSVPTPHATASPAQRRKSALTDANRTAAASPNSPPMIKQLSSVAAATGMMPVSPQMDDPTRRRTRANKQVS